MIVLPEVYPDRSVSKCNFTWLNAETRGPVDPACQAPSTVILIRGKAIRGAYKDHRCLAHAAYDLAETLCGQLGMQRTSVPPTAFRSLCSFFEVYVATRLWVIQKERTS